MIVSRAHEGDLPAILELEQGGFPAPERWGRLAWRDELLASDRYVMAARDADDRLMAVATFQCIAAGHGPVAGGVDADLHRIVVAREHRGEGAAKRMVRAGMEWAAALGAERMLLEVREDNEAALGLYDGTGFRPIARRENYYGPGVHAIVMAAPLGELAPVADHDGWSK